MKYGPIVVDEYGWKQEVTFDKNDFSILRTNWKNLVRMAEIKTNEPSNKLGDKNAS